MLHYWGTSISTFVDNGWITMRLGLNLGQMESEMVDYVPLAREADRLGYHSIWTSEAWGADCVTTLTWLAANTERVHVGTAIMQMPARSPANTAMTAASLDWLTGGRVLLGLGVSGPQVVEGWHGIAYGKPLVRTREYVEIVRAILQRRRTLTYRGECYQIPLQGGTGLGRPLKLMLHPLRDGLPIYLAAIGPKNVALAGEIADGLLPIFFSAKRSMLFLQPLEEGFGRAGGGKNLSNFDVAPTVLVQLGNDVRFCRDALKPTLALYIGGMGAPNQNFYFNLVCRYGYEDAAARIQNLYLQGRKEESAAAVPDALVDEVSLCGPRERISDMLTLWRASGITTLIIRTSDVQAVRMMAELVL